VEFSGCKCNTLESAEKSGMSDAIWCPKGIVEERGIRAMGEPACDPAKGAQRCKRHG
jgi:hypothetical protein